MSNGGVISISNAPRDLGQLSALKLGVLFRLGHQLQLFPDEAAEQTFLGADTASAAQHILMALQRHDQGAGANGGQQALPQAQPQQPMMQPPVMQQQPTMPTMAPAMPQQQPMMQQPAMGVPSMPAVQPPPPATQQAPRMPSAAPGIALGMPSMPGAAMPGMQPAMPMPQQMPVAMPGSGPGMPPMPPAPAMAPPGAPGMPPMPGGMLPMQQPQAAAPRQPQTASDPNNIGARPMAPPQQQQLPSMQPAMPPAQPQQSGDANVLGQILQATAQLAQGIKIVGEKNQEWMEEIDEQQDSILTALRACLLTNIYLATQVLNVDPATLAKFVKMAGIDLAAYVGHFEEEEEGNA